MTLDELRARIDALDEQILELLNARAKCAIEIGKIKRSNDAVYYVPEREKAIVQKLKQKNKGPLPESAVHGIYREVISAIRALEKATAVAYLGPSHTFSHMAALKIFGASAEFHPMASVSDIFTEVERKRIDYGVVPVESAMGGGVSDTLDRFLASDLNIINEVMLHITQNLLSNGPVEEIHKVYSKDQSFLQCRVWLKANLPGAELINTSSTSEAARIAASEQGAAAIASTLAAEAHDLNIVAAGIEDASHNYTRFFVIGRQKTTPSGHDKTSVLLSVKDQPGALYALLLPFASAGVNLTRIESRPSKKKPWEYVFFIDMVGHTEEPAVKEALQKVAEHCNEMKILGSYPVGEIED
ncbi:MAG TPA: prephenate dehydratase [Candidatus Hydrogenedentes bacterium]|nr:prephenate dehydratase [Candidatus Hydrogenedentota bacterium]